MLTQTVSQGSKLTTHATYIEKLKGGGVGKQQCVEMVAKITSYCIDCALYSSHILPYFTLPLANFQILAA